MEFTELAGDGGTLSQSPRLSLMGMGVTSGEGEPVVEEKR